MDKEFEVVLTGPARVRGKREDPGKTVCVTKAEIRDLAKAKAVAPDALELADTASPSDQSPSTQSDILASAQADAFRRADALQLLNEELLAKNRELQARLDTAETDKADLASEIAKAKAAISEPETEFAGTGNPEPIPEPATDKPAAKPAAKTTRKTPAKSTAAKPAKS